MGDETPPLEEHPSITTGHDVDKAAAALEAAHTAHVEQAVASTHSITTSLLHEASTYVEFVENGVHRVEQIIGR